MAEVPGEQGSFCIDRYEAALELKGAGKQRAPWPSNESIDGNEAQLSAVSRANQKPQGYISGEQAALACQNAGKRLCAPSEWKTACRGPEQSRYPYGNTRRAGVCNDRFDKPTGHPVLRLFKQTKTRGDKPAKMWSPTFMNDPRLHELSDTVTPTGSLPECTNGYGVFDMVGNLHEWVADPKGTFMGGFFMDTHLNGEGCDYRTTAHHFGYHDYSTGFRCCVDAANVD
jgi:formylglycine-generating enzyme required for sulfatase activity